ncbi:alpha/beta fold hydrolase [Actinoplanes sp. NPDC026619]|uniref:alpha/beta fold hydrolase n=1 Tax=Actinoplanes sp. NPDC026619 TaxID=3155798 RepID=UPI003410B8AA
MPFLQSNGIQLSYQSAGQGENVLLIMGSSAAGHVWTLHQTPALNAAGYRTIVFNNRGVPPSDVPPGRYSLADMVADTKGLIEALDLAPCRIVGTSLGALIAQELAIGWPHLVRCAVLMATRARADTYRRAQTIADQVLAESGLVLPAKWSAVDTVQRMLSPATLNDDAAVASWLEVFEMAGDTRAGDARAGDGGQAWVDTDGDRRVALRGVTVPCRVIAFADDTVTPPHLAAEVADAIEDCDLVELPRAGHLGYLERPAEVNSAIVEFLDKN